VTHYVDRYLLRVVLFFWIFVVVLDFLLNAILPDETAGVEPPGGGDRLLRVERECCHAEDQGHADESCQSPPKYEGGEQASGGDD